MGISVDLSDSDLEELDRLAGRLGLARSQIIRAAISEYLARNTLDSDDSAFGLWRGRGPDGLEHQHNVRAEWTPA